MLLSVDRKLVLEIRPANLLYSVFRDHKCCKLINSYISVMDVALLIVFSIKKMVKELMKYAGKVKHAMAIVIKGTVY